MGFRRTRREEIRPELTPMIDVVFLLLIFFMISTTFVEAPGITVDLPESQAQREEKAPEEIEVYLDKEGKIFIGEQPVTFGELEQRLAGYGQDAVKTTFLLYADTDSRHGVVVKVMDAARKAGFRKLAIATEYRGEP